MTGRTYLSLDMDRYLRSADPADFAPALARIQEKPPAPLTGSVLKLLFVMLACFLAWAAFGKLDIVAVAEGKLVPQTYLKVVQPAEQGVVKEILVREGDAVSEGQVLMRMDPMLAEADTKTLLVEHHARRLALRRIDAQLAGGILKRQPDDPPEHFARVEAQYVANVSAYQNALAQERSVLEKTNHDLAAAEEIRAKLIQVLPHYREQERAFDKLAKEGFAGRLMYTDKQRERIEKEQDLKTQDFAIQSARATIAQSEKKLAQITADYRRLLQTERVEVAAQLEKTREELAKQAHRRQLLELKAPQSGLVKDLVTHTPGTVVGPGVVLMTLVPNDERLRAEVWIANQDVGFVRPGQGVKLKLATFQFQKYGMVDGVVSQVGADASEGPSPGARADGRSGRDAGTGQLAFRALVDLKSEHLESDGHRHRLAPGMQVVAEIKLGSRTVLEYLLSPVQRAFHEAGRER
jgi:hemolysin D